MSVQTQIDRIAEGVSNALTALTDKGVTAPDGANVDSLAELIAAIEAGASNVEVISFVPASSGLLARLSGDMSKLRAIFTLTTDTFVDDASIDNLYTVLHVIVRLSDDSLQKIRVMNNSTGVLGSLTTKNYSWGTSTNSDNIIAVDTDGKLYGYVAYKGLIAGATYHAIALYID